jgi:tryptophanyl-tRNA synthetase
MRDETRGSADAAQPQLVARRPRILSGIQPTGSPHIGNYVGAISQWVRDQESYESLFCVVDLHALTIPDELRGQSIRTRSLETAAMILACGIDPTHSTLFLQSQVPAHVYLGWIVICMSPLGWLRRMVQFKSKSANADGAGAGLLCYPALQAADILLYEADLVPVGHDQVQHVEFARDLAIRMNSAFGIDLKIPNALVRETGARIMALDNPLEKMSKSRIQTNPNHAITLLDTPDEVRTKLRRAVTDSNTHVVLEAMSPGIKNLVALYAVLSGTGPRGAEEELDGKSYGELKRRVADAVIAILEPIQERYRKYLDAQDYLDKVLSAGSATASHLAANVIGRVNAALGLSPTAAYRPD